MHGMRLMLVGLVAAGMVGASTAWSQVEIGPVKIEQEDLKEIYRAVGRFFGLVDEDEVYRVRERGISEDELAVVLFLAQKAGVPWLKVVEERQKGKSWDQICRSLGLSPQIFFVELKQYPSGPPYGRAYGYWKNRHKHKWQNVVLTDEEVINLVNLKFISECYHYSPQEVIRLRSGGDQFLHIHHKIKGKAKGQKSDKSGPGERGSGEKKADKGQGGSGAGPEGTSPGAAEDKDKQGNKGSSSSPSGSGAGQGHGSDNGGEATSPPSGGKGRGKGGGKKQPH